jgi:hypothetical protein
MSDKLTLFPLLGITYRFILSAKDGNGESYKDSSGSDRSGDFSALWFRFGGGLDYSITDQIYFRGGLSYGLRLSNKFEDDMVDQSGGILDTRLGHGLEIKAAVGYRF